ncbi:glycosyl hydrolase family 8 [Clostridium paraputrificum]|uniref:glycosyl hydrolase family 8 n=1 Tax=Clostridium TaxID=1485 RepID=UPI003D3300EF
MNKKRKIILSVFILVIISISAIYFLLPYIKPIKSGVVWQNNQVSERERILLEFIDNNLKNDEWGIKTNYNDEISDGDITKGHSVLSESQGMMLLYYLDRDRKGEFDNTLVYVEKNMFLPNGVLSWRVEEGESSETSATIDDLRVIKALLLGEERWGDKKYRKVALNISRGIKKELLDEGMLSDFNDGTNKSDKTTLCYLDLPTIKLISKLDKDYNDIYKNSLEIMNGGYISDEIPLYKKEYDRKSNLYDDGDIDTLLSSIILLNRVEVGEDISKSIEWIKSKYKEDGGIFISYSKDTGKAISSIESTSIYSNLLQVASLLEDTELYNICIKKLEEYQILDVNNPIYGAYGNGNTKEVYSFDNLNALLAWRRVKNS